MKRYIQASKDPFISPSPEGICKAVETIFNGYIAKKDFLSGSKQYVYAIDKSFGKGLDIVVGVRDKSDWVPHALYSSSNADNLPCYFKILDNPDNMELLDAFKRLGFTEVCNYRNSQWGTYKIAIKSLYQLKRAFKVFEHFVMNDLEDYNETLY